MKKLTLTLAVCALVVVTAYASTFTVGIGTFDDGSELIVIGEDNGCYYVMQSEPGQPNPYCPNPAGTCMARDAAAQYPICTAPPPTPRDPQRSPQQY